MGFDRRQIGLVGESIGPLGSLVDPGLDDADLFRSQRAGWRHLQTVFGPGHPVVKEAVFAAARHDAAEAGLKDGASAVEPQAVHLLRRSVTTNTVLPEHRQDIPAEIDLGWSLGDGSYNQTRPYNRESSILSEHNPLWSAIFCW